jgi:hypothetical protein
VALVMGDVHSSPPLVLIHSIFRLAARITTVPSRVRGGSGTKMQKCLFLITIPKLFDNDKLAFILGSASWYFRVGKISRRGCDEYR